MTQITTSRLPQMTNAAVWRQRRGTRQLKTAEVLPGRFRPLEHVGTSQECPGIV